MKSEEVKTKERLIAIRLSLAVSGIMLSGMPALSSATPNYPGDGTPVGDAEIDAPRRINLPYGERASRWLRLSLAGDYGINARYRWWGSLPLGVSVRRNGRLSAKARSRGTYVLRIQATYTDLSGDRLRTPTKKITFRVAGNKK